MMTKRQLRAQATFDEYRRFSDAFDCTFRQWLDIRKTQWYDDLKNDRLRPWWDSEQGTTPESRQEEG